MRCNGSIGRHLRVGSGHGYGGDGLREGSAFDGEATAMTARGNKTSDNERDGRKQVAMVVLWHVAWHRGGATMVD